MALPAELPPAVYLSSMAFLVMRLLYPYKPKEPMPLSSIFVCPTIMAPASLSFVTAVASIGDLKPLRTRDAALDYMPSTRILSLMAIGIPSIRDKCSSTLL